MRAARELFRDPGIRATGVAELCAAAHVSKRTLYQHFPSKDDVVLAYLRECEEDEAARLGDETIAPRARLLELFDALADDARPHRGDPFVNAAVELSDPAHPAHRLAAACQLRFAQRLSDLAREAGARNADEVGRRLALLYAGAAAQMVVGDSAGPAGEARAIAASILRDVLG